MRRRAVDLYFCKQGKADVIVQRTETLDFVLIPRLLVAELVAGKPQHRQAVFTMPAIQVLQARILRRKTALAGRIDDQQDLAAIGCERLRLAIDCLHVDIVNVFHVFAGRELMYDKRRASAPFLSKINRRASSMKSLVNHSFCQRALRVGSLGLLGGCFAAIVVFAAAATADDDPKVRVELRRAETEAAPGLTEVKVVGNERPIYLHAKAELSNEDIAAARVSEENGLFSLDVTLTDDGALKMARMSSEHLQKPLAVLIDGKVICAPTVRSKIQKTFQITGDFGKAEAERIAGGLTGKAIR